MTTSYPRRNQKNKKYRQFIVGQHTKSYALHLPGKIAMAGIVFKPTGIAALLQVPMFVLTEERVDLGVFVPSAVVEATSCKIVDATGAQQRVLLLEDFIHSFYLKN